MSESFDALACSQEPLNLVDVANDFIAGNDHRKHIFGTEFKPSDQDQVRLQYISQVLCFLCIDLCIFLCQHLFFSKQRDRERVLLILLLYFPCAYIEAAHNPAVRASHR